MADIDDLDDMAGLIDAVDDPECSPPRRVTALEFPAQRNANPVGLSYQCACDELNDGGSDCLG